MTSSCIWLHPCRHSWSNSTISLICRQTQSREPENWCYWIGAFSWRKDELKDSFEDVSENVPDFCHDDEGDYAILSDSPATSLSDVLVDYTFPSVLIARLYLLYWASVILVFESLIALVRDLSEQATNEEDQILVTGSLPSVHVLENMTT